MLPEREIRNKGAIPGVTGESYRMLVLMNINTSKGEAHIIEMIAASGVAGPLTIRESTGPFLKVD